jgi:hypothetical protein
VGAVCPSGYVFDTELGGCNNTGNTGPASVGSSAVATIAGHQYELSSLANLAPCGFAPATAITIAVAVSESGSILVTGQQPSTYGDASVTCLLTPAASVNGVPQFDALPL